MPRGTARNTKKAAKPDAFGKAQIEIEKAAQSVERGFKYLRQQLDKAVKEDGNERSVRAITKFFLDHQSKALEVMERSAALRGASTAEAVRRRYDITGDLGANGK